MFKLIMFLITGEWCNHKWESVEKINVYGTNKSIELQIPTSVDYITKCSGCGKVKKFRT